MARISACARVPGVIRRRRLHQVRKRLGRAVVSFLLLLLPLGLSGQAGRASGRGMLRASTYESIMLMGDRAAVSLPVVVAPFPMESHAVSWGWLLDGGCRGGRPRGS